VTVKDSWSRVGIHLPIQHTQGSNVPDYMLRQTPDLTLVDLHDAFADRPTRSTVVDAESVRFDAADAYTMSFRPKEGGDEIEVPLGDLTVANFATLLEIPLPFLKRQDPGIQSYLLNTLMQRKGGTMVLDHDDASVQEIRGLGMEKMDPRGVIDVAIRVLGEDAKVIESWKSIDKYRFDVVVHDGSSFGIGGDLKVGDLTKGGLRFEQETKRRRAPQVSAFMYRLVCTNGMEVADLVSPLDKRDHNGVLSMLGGLEENARTILDLLDHQIQSFYDLRNQPVDNAEQMLVRLRQERGFSDRMLTEMIERTPALLDDPENPTMFDVVNIITNMANHPDLQSREGGRRSLELAGGHVIGEHAHRCPTCQSALI
jgi:hypothetical protein